MLHFIEKLFSKKKEEDPEIAILVSPADDVETELICGILKENQIPCFSKAQKAGNYTKIIMGFSPFGSDIYVRRCDLEKGQMLLEILHAQPTPPCEPTESVNPISAPGSPDNNEKK